MLSLEEQVARKCIHFTGIMDKVCKAGIKYAEVRDESQKPYGFPCIQTGGQCPNAQYRTPEEVKSYIAEMQEEGMKTLGAVALVKSHFEKTKMPSGKIQCHCGGDLFYAVASNGHARGKCNKCKLSFVE